MKKKLPFLLSVLILCFTFIFVVNFTGVNAIESEPETSTTTTTTTKKIETTKQTVTSSSINFSSVLSSIGDNLTGTKTTVTTTSTTTAGSETHSEHGSETEKPGTTAKTTTAATTKKVTTTIKRMTVTIVGNTTLPGTTMDPLSAYYSRLSENGTDGGQVTAADPTTKAGEETREANPAVTVIIVVAAMLIAISVLTGIFSLRNKKLAEKEAALEKSDALDSYDVIISQKPTQPTFTQTPVDDVDETPVAPEQPEFTQTAVDDDDDLTSNALKADEPQASSLETDETPVLKPEDAPEPGTDGEKGKTDGYEDIFSGRDDL